MALTWAWSLVKACSGRPYASSMVRSAAATPATAPTARTFARFVRRVMPHLPSKRRAVTLSIGPAIPLSYAFAQVRARSCAKWIKPAAGLSLDDIAAGYRARDTARTPDRIPVS